LSASRKRRPGHPGTLQSYSRRRWDVDLMAIPMGFGDACSKPSGRSIGTGARPERPIRANLPICLEYLAITTIAAAVVRILQRSLSAVPAALAERSIDGIS
jgi:hypothetical protein